ncbi:MAG: hypothetical protein MZV70_29125 [Desulfobacterales bacterium]|nr:hypothetical protein [Desulfobacterales bacterium]
MVATASDVAFDVLMPPKEYSEGYQDNVKKYDQMIKEDLGLPILNLLAVKVLLRIWRTVSAFDGPSSYRDLGSSVFVSALE